MEDEQGKKSRLTTLMLVCFLLLGCEVEVIHNEKNEAELGSHKVVIKPFYRSISESVKHLDDGSSLHRFKAGDVEVIILDGAVDLLKVNGVFYGQLNSVDDVLIDNGTIFVSGTQREPQLDLTKLTTLVPDEAGKVALVKQSINDFVVSVNKEDMSFFYSTVSRDFQENQSVESFNSHFEKYMNLDFDWSMLDEIAPTFGENTFLRSDGTLQLVGQYRIDEEDLVSFEQIYIYEDETWKIVGFKL